MFEKNDFLFLAFVILLLQSCLFSEKEPEELIKLKHIATRDAQKNNKKTEKLADYLMKYGYFDYVDGTVSENFNTNTNERLWKNQLWKSCDTEIFPEEEPGFLDMNSFYREYVSFLSRFYGYRNVEKIASYDITLVNDYDSLREYERFYTTEDGLQKKNIESFIRVNNKWLVLSKGSYNFAESQDRNESASIELSTKELPAEFMGDTIRIYVQDDYRVRFLRVKDPKGFQIFSYELIGVLKRSLVPEDTRIIIAASPEIIMNILYHIADLLEWNGYNYIAFALDSSQYQHDLSKHNEKLKTKFEGDIITGFASLNRTVCGYQPVAFAIDSLDKVHILPKYVLFEPVDYELVKHYLIQSIQLNRESLQIMKNRAYCLDLFVCPEK